MTAKDIKQIQNRIFDVCHDVEKNIVVNSDTEAFIWAKQNSLRHAHAIKTIQEHAHVTGKTNLKILNASGLSCGSQDFATTSYLKKYTNLSFEWTALESPNSSYLSNDKFCKFVDMSGIQIELVDFSSTWDPDAKHYDRYDIVLFTEIAEHLDHSILLKTLKQMRGFLREDGLMIMTTPNLTSIINRLKILMGNGDGTFWGDGHSNLEKGLFGHIVQYDLQRLIRLLQDSGYSIERAYTFNYAYRSLGSRSLRTIFMIGTDFLSEIINHSAATIFVAAQKGAPVAIPLQV